MRKLASIVKISAVSPIPNADKLDVVEMEGKAWRVVTAKGDFRPGDMAVYFEIDSALPADDERFAFLRDRCLRTFRTKHGKVVKEVLRIRTIKLRGVISQGLLMPLALFPELAAIQNGYDEDEILHVEHFDEVTEQMRAMLDTRIHTQTKREGNFPTFIPKTDEERIQNLADWCQAKKGMLFEVTEKNDGSSMTAFWAPALRPDKPFGVCSRNYELQRDDENVWWKAALKYNLEEKLASTGRQLAFQGELVGPGMNGNRDLYAEHEFHVFRIWDITGNCYVPSGERVKLCKALGLPHVKIIDPAKDVFNDLGTVDDILLYAEGTTDRGNEREGLVFKEADSKCPCSFKAVSNRYLLKVK